MELLELSEVAGAVVDGFVCALGFGLFVHTFVWVSLAVSRAFRFRKVG